jgi:hypothetical protein
MTPLERVQSHLNVVTPGTAVYQPPLALAYGLGVDSSSILPLWKRMKVRPDLIIFSNVGNEKKETYDYLPIMNEWLVAQGWPEVTVVQTEVKDFKHWPPYNSLGENCFTNGTLPSLAFGFKSCSLKWKVVPQNDFCSKWGPAVEAWAMGYKVRKVIGYDASDKDRKRFAHAVGMEDPAYDYWYPLIEQKVDREGCKQILRDEGLPVPPKSACIFCPATQPEELHEFRKSYLRYICVMEARGHCRLEGNMTQYGLDCLYAERMAIWHEKMARYQEELARATARNQPLNKKPPKEPRKPVMGQGVQGLWRRGRLGVRGGKKMPSHMSVYIWEQGLLPKEEVVEIWQRAPQEILDNQQAFANGEDIPNWHDFLEMFSPEDALDEVPGCGGCQMVSV